MNIIQELEREQMDAVTAKRGVPEFGPGDTVKVMVKVERRDPKDKKAKGKVERDAPAGLRGRRDRAAPAPASTRTSPSARFPTARAWSACSRSTRPTSPRSRSCAAARSAAPSSITCAAAAASRPVSSSATDARARRLNAAWKGFKKPKGEAEDLTQIKGIDADLAGRLQQLNAIKLEQIANLSDDDIANLDEALQLDGRIEKDDWVGQAQRLVAEAAAAEVPAEDDKKA